MSTLLQVGLKQGDSFPIHFSNMTMKETQKMLRNGISDLDRDWFEFAFDEGSIMVPKENIASLRLEEIK